MRRRERNGAWSRAPRVLVALALLLGLTLGGVGTLRPVNAQGAAEPSADEATMLLLPYLLGEDDAPDGYSLTTTNAYPGEAEAFDAVMIPPPDPRPMEALLTRVTNAGRIVRLKQGFESDDDDAPDLSFAIAAFNGASDAARALKDPSLLTFVLPDAKVATVAATGFSPAADGVAAFTIDQTQDEDAGPERTTLLVWQHGPLALAVGATGSQDQADAALPTLVALATRADANYAAQPPLPQRLADAPAYLGTAAKRLALYKALVDRLPADDFLGDKLQSNGVNSIPNGLLILDSRIADKGFSDPRAVSDRLLKAERRVLGVTKELEAASTAGDETSASAYPKVAVGYHVYADADSAHEAFNASLDEMAVRLNEEIYLTNDPKRQPVVDLDAPTDLGEQARKLLSDPVVLDDGSKVSVGSMRWRHGSVELFMDIAVPYGQTDPDDSWSAIQQLDAALTSHPLPAR